MATPVQGDGPQSMNRGRRVTAEEVSAGIDLLGKVALVTGANSGIGHETARVLALRGARVLVAARSRAKAESACASLVGRVEPVVCALDDLDSVVACAEGVLGQAVPLDILVCNAGVMALPSVQRVRGVERQLFVNHVGHFALVNWLLPTLTPTARVVVVSSRAHRRAPAQGIRFDDLACAQGYRPWQAYGQSKLANILFVRELASRLPSPRQTANALHPGVIATPLMRHLPGPVRAAARVAGKFFFKTVAQGAATTVYVACHPEVASQSGQYFADCRLVRPSRRAQDPMLARRLWQVSVEILEEAGVATGVC